MEEDQLTPMGKLLLLVDGAPRCACGGNCQTLQYLVKELIDAQDRQLVLPNSPLRTQQKETSQSNTLVSWLQND